MTKKKVVKKKVAKKSGPKLLDFDWKLLDSILQYHANKRDAAELLGVSEDTIDRRIKAEHGKSFLQYRETKLGRVRIQLIQTAIEQAKTGKNPAVLIFCLKNLCKWSDKQEIEVGEKTRKEFKLAYNLEESDDE